MSHLTNKTIHNLFISIIDLIKYITENTTNPILAECC